MSDAVLKLAERWAVDHNVIVRDCAKELRAMLDAPDRSATTEGTEFKGASGKPTTGRIDPSSPQLPPGGAPAAPDAELVRLARALVTHLDVCHPMLTMAQFRVIAGGRNASGLDALRAWLDAHAPKEPK